MAHRHRDLLKIGRDFIGHLGARFSVRIHRKRSTLAVNRRPLGQQGFDFFAAAGFRQVGASAGRRGVDGQTRHDHVDRGGEPDDGPGSADYIAVCLSEHRSAAQRNDRSPEASELVDQLAFQFSERCFAVFGEDGGDTLAGAALDFLVGIDRIVAEELGQMARTVDLPVPR